MKEEILKLKHGECYIVPEGDYGKAEIWLINNVYILFEIPMYGGEPQYCDCFIKNHVDEMIDKINSWT